ncbi:RNA-binding domain-containing protein [Nakamurella sp. A5-74]|uniref:RNA-binding domain-containing protein n=1 Tax=Nakamurella sp. A5-74 TaxID=3158264 RepID=A0AAU8DTJ6_9ACTN
MHNYEAVTPDQLLDLCAHGETLTVEFKRGGYDRLKDSLIVEAVVCLANGEGGLLLLGIEDDGRITGLEPRHRDVTDPDRLAAMILNKTEPNIASVVELVEAGGVEVAVVHVPKASSPAGTTEGRFIRRTLRADGRPECVPYRAHEIVSAGLSALGTDYASVPARGADLHDLDPAEFDRFRRMTSGGKGERALAVLSDQEIMRALRVHDPMSGELTLGAVLLFGTDRAIRRFVPTAETLFQEQRGDEIVTNEQLQAPLFKTAEQIEALLRVRNTEQELIVGMHRIGIPRIPPAVVREVLANALVHRDYTELGCVRVRLTDTYLRVSSPGGFPPGITFDNLLEDTRPRSPIIAEAFKRAGMVDRYGRGIPQMYGQLLRWGRAGPDYSLTNDTSVVVEIPTSDADLEMVRFVIDFEDSASVRLPLDQLRLLHQLKDVGDSDVSGLSSSLRMTEQHTRTSLARLTEMGLVEQRGQGRGRRVHLAAAFYRSAQASEYVRMRDTDPLQQEQMMLAYVDQFGRITRSKAAELCRLSPQQARNVLKRLVDQGQLSLEGMRRGAHYVKR